MSKYAFLTGVNGYSLLPSLRFARQDAEDVAAALRENYGFADDEITLMTDGQRDAFFMPTSSGAIVARLEELEGTNPDLFIFGFWGHGYFQKQLYFCPMGVSEERAAEEGLPMATVIQLIGRIGAKNAILLLDCCQSAIPRGKTEPIRKMTEAEVNAARSIVLNPNAISAGVNTNITILHACDVGQCAYEWDQRNHGIFTAHLLDAFNARLDSVSSIVSKLGGQIKTTAQRLGHTQTPLFLTREDIPLPVVTKKDGQIFVHLPDRAEDMKIIRPEIDDIKITVSAMGSTEAQPIDSTVIELPPIPSHLVRLRSENQGLDEAISQLQAGTHPALRQAQEAVQTVLAQVESLANKKAQTWQVFSNAGGDVPQLEKWVQNNPEASVMNITHLCPQNMAPDVFIDLVVWGQQWVLATAEYHRVGARYNQKYQSKIAEIEAIKSRNLASQKGAIEQLRQTAIMTVLSAIPGYDQLNAPFPEREGSRLCRELDKYQMDWDRWQLVKDAVSLWGTKRPVVLAKESHRAWANETRAGTRKVLVVNDVEFAFRYCPKGVFVMGSPAGFWGFGGELGRSWDETQHQVTIRQGFWLMETAVTQKQWKAVMGTTIQQQAKKMLEDNTIFDFGGSYGKKTMRDYYGFKRNEDPYDVLNGVGPDYPMYYINWNECQEFCRKLSSLSDMTIKLPSETQWEYACRAGTETALYNGNIEIKGAYNAPNLDPIAWYGGNSSRGFNQKSRWNSSSWGEMQYPGGPTGAHEAGKKQPNAWFLYDMIGNVWEWCEDVYVDSILSRSTDRPYLNGSEFVSRVSRGGSWDSQPHYCRSACRDYSSPMIRGYNVGLRVALVAK